LYLISTYCKVVQLTIILNGHQMVTDFLGILPFQIYRQ